MSGVHFAWPVAVVGNDDVVAGVVVVVVNNVRAVNVNVGLSVVGCSFVETDTAFRSDGIVGGQVTNSM